MKLSILICTIPERSEMFYSLVNSLSPQLGYNQEIVFNNSTELSIGEKRNNLLKEANGEYVCFIDDDDSVPNDYIYLLMEGIDKGVDCCSLRGEYFVDGVLHGMFEHSIKYKAWKTIEGSIKYIRTPNHLNCIKSSIAKQFKFPEKNFGEDHDWSKQIHESGLIKTEHYIPEVIYYYKKVTHVQPK